MVDLIWNVAYQNGHASVIYVLCIDTIVFLIHDQFRIEMYQQKHGLVEVP